MQSNTAKQNAINLSILIPVYNSENILPTLIERLEQTLPSLAEAYEVILVNDGSTDKSWNVIIAQAQKRPWLRGINLGHNCGQHAALITGLRVARHEIIVTMDSDLQHPPEEIKTLLLKLSEGYDLVYGLPLKRVQGRMRNLIAKAFYGLLEYVGRIPYARSISSFRAFHIKLRASMKIIDGSKPFLHFLLVGVTQNIGAVHLRYDKRFVGRSSYNSYKLLAMAAGLIRETLLFHKRKMENKALEYYVIPITHYMNF